MKRLAKSIISCLLVVMMMILCACNIPLDIDKAKSKMQKNGYHVMDYYSYYGYDEEEDAIEGLLGGFVATKRTLGAGITVLYFEDVDYSKAYYSKIRDEIKSAERSGSCIYWGTEVAIEEFER